LRAASRTDYAPHVAGVDLNEGNRVCPAEEAAGAFWVLITARYAMSLPGQQLRKIAAGRARAEDEDAHRLVNVS
jgi:hypothetical protein